MAVSMKYFMKKIFFVCIGLLLFFSSNANEGGALYSKFCSACHTIGSGRLVGPDLINISEKRSQEWLLAYIPSSQTVIKSGDADAVAIYKEYNNLLMPDQALNTSQVTAVISYINDVSSGNISGGSQAVAIDILANTTDENIARGLLLFSGKERLSNGGSSCVSCHSVRDDRIFSSGTLAKDLTETHETMKSAGVSAILKSPPFPAMAVTYKDSPLTEEEVIDLTAYLRSVSVNRYYQHPVNFSISFFVLGSLAFVTLLIGIIILYYNRKTKSVYHDIHKRQSSIIN